MVELKALSPVAGMLPIAAGDCRLEAVEHGHLTLLSVYKGQKKQLSEALVAAHGVRLAAPNRSTSKAGVRCLWFGHDQVLLIGPPPDHTFGQYASVVDQSDSWAVVRLQGGQAVDVLARLTSVDLRPAVFKRGHTLRTELRHMMVSISCVGVDAFEIMAFRSMAKTLVDDLSSAMASIAAQ